MLNKVILQGRMTADAELKTTNSGKTVTSFSIAVERNFKVNGEKQTDFFTVVAWGKTAEHICQYFRKGSLMIVEGDLQNRKWKDKDGNGRTSTEINASSVYFCESKKPSEAVEPMPIPQDAQFEPISENEELPF